MKCKTCENQIEKYAEKNYQTLCRKCHYEKYGKASDRRCRKAARDKVLAHYGNKCNYCDSTIDLHVDHIGGDGSAARKLNSCARSSIAKTIIKENFPTTYQLLCRKCNLAKNDMSDKDFREFVDLLYARFHK